MTTNGKAAVQQHTETPETNSGKFVSLVERQFTSEMGDALDFSDFQRTLAHHLYLKTDAQLKALEARRQDTGGRGTPITWENVNLAKLALDAVHRVNLGLDALIPNHIHPIPYWNKRTNKYDLDLYIGYEGLLYVRRQMAVDRPVNVIIELVHESDVFVPFMRSRDNPVESYQFEITNPFDRGGVIGGFGYIEYEEPANNELILVTPRDFAKAEGAARTKDFWADDKWRLEMMRKTVVRRVADRLPIDPLKVNARSLFYIEAQEIVDSADRTEPDDEDGPVIDIDADHTVASNSDGPEEAQTIDEPEPEQTPVAEPTQATMSGPGF